MPVNCVTTIQIKMTHFQTQGLEIRMIPYGASIYDVCTAEGGGRRKADLLRMFCDFYSINHSQMQTRGEGQQIQKLLWLSFIESTLIQTDIWFLPHYLTLSRLQSCTTKFMKTWTRCSGLWRMRFWPRAGMVDGDKAVHVRLSSRENRHNMNRIAVRQTFILINFKHYQPEIQILL